MQINFNVHYLKKNTMKQFVLTEAYNGYPAQTVFQGPYPAKSQSNKIYCPMSALPGPEGTDMGIFASFVERNSDLFSVITSSESKTPSPKEPGV